MPLYRIFVFNTRNIKPAKDKSLLGAITGANLDALCAQYDLDPTRIESTLAHLSLTCGKKAQISPYLVLYYGPKAFRPILVFAFPVDGDQGRRIIQRALSSVGHEALKKPLNQTAIILAIELSQDQLRDMGLLLAYEVARWAAEQGQGLVRGLDGKWYRLNRHHAFIPLDSDVCQG